MRRPAPGDAVVQADGGATGRGADLEEVAELTRHPQAVAAELRGVREPVDGGVRAVVGDVADDPVAAAPKGDPSTAAVVEGVGGHLVDRDDQTADPGGRHAQRRGGRGDESTDFRQVTREPQDGAGVPLRGVVPAVEQVRGHEGRIGLGDRSGHQVRVAHRCAAAAVPPGTGGTGRTRPTGPGEQARVVLADRRDHHRSVGRAARTPGQPIGGRSEGETAVVTDVTGPPPTSTTATTRPCRAVEACP